MDDPDHRAGCALPVPKVTAVPSVFRPEALLREARRQRGLAALAPQAAYPLDPVAQGPLKFPR